MPTDHRPVEPLGAGDYHSSFEPRRSLYFTDSGLERLREMLQNARNEVGNATMIGDTDKAQRIADSVFVSIAALAGLGGYVAADTGGTDLYCVQTQGPLHFGVNVSSRDRTWSVNS